MDLDLWTAFTEYGPKPDILCIDSFYFSFFIYNFVLWLRVLDNADHTVSPRSTHLLYHVVS